jgi:ABC-type multidrug transport system fused ATPase/permease subunit
VRDLRTLLRVTWALDRHRVVAQVVLLVLGGVLGGAGLVLLVPIVGSIAGDGPTGIPGIGDLGFGDWPLAALLAAFVGITVIQAAITRSASVNSALLQQRVVDRLRHDAFEAILAARWSFVVGIRQSDIVQVVTTGAQRSGLAIAQLVSSSVSGLLALVSAAVAIAVEPVLGSVAVVAVVMVAIAQGSGIRPAHRLGVEFGERSRQLQAVITDSLDSLRLVRAHDASAVWVERLGDAFTGTREVQVANTRRMSTVAALTSVGMAVAASGLVLGATWLDVPPASIVVMIVLVNRLSGQMRSVVQTSTVVANSLPAVRDVTDLTARAAAERETPASVTDEPTVGHGPLVELRDVTFRYRPDGGEPTGGVTDLRLEVPEGRITAITGPSGAGKSTTADLVLGLLTPDTGQVLIRGVPLTADRLTWWRRHVAYVPQETIVFPGTLRDNLAWSVGRQVTDDECRQALIRAAATFVERLPDGLDTTLGDRGIRLSGGERQRVAIARALLRRPTLLVLDESTSSLDDETERAVLDTIGSLTPAVTVLVIAHRRTTLDLADHVVTLRGS